MEEKGFVTLCAAAEDEFIERKSRFIGSIAPAQTEEQALCFLAQKKSLYRDATHHVFAYLLRGGPTRCSDDGEPQGTAGVPVLDVLQKEGLSNVCVVVTRYFGGILLGAGGLVRAYSHTAKLAVDAAQRLPQNLCTVLEAEFDYSLYGKISYSLPKYKVRTLQSNFGALVCLRLLLRQCYAEAFCKELQDLSSARITLRTLGHEFADLD